MPVVCRFEGIVVTMYFSDHAPPHFHASKGAFKIVVDIETGRTKGNLPIADLRRTERWRKLHVLELMENWARARKGQPIVRIRAS